MTPARGTWLLTMQPTKIQDKHVTEGSVGDIRAAMLAREPIPRLLCLCTTPCASACLVSTYNLCAVSF